MKKSFIKIRYTFLFFMIVLTPFASAYIDLIIHIDKSGNCIFLGETNEAIEIPNIKIEDGKIIGENSCTSKNKEIWIFEFELKNAEMTVFLPENSIVRNLEDGEISIYEPTNPFERERIVVYAKDKTSIDYSIGEDKFDYEVLYSIIISIIILTALTLYYMRSQNTKAQQKNKKSKRSNKTNKLATIKEILNDRDKKIIDVLEKHGKIKSSYLRKLSEIPKASFFRHITELEKKRIIKKSGEGKNKFVEAVK